MLDQTNIPLVTTNHYVTDYMSDIENVMRYFNIDQVEKRRYYENNTYEKRRYYKNNTYGEKRCYGENTYEKERKMLK